MDDISKRCDKGCHDNLNEWDVEDVPSPEPKPGTEAFRLYWDVEDNRQPLLGLKLVAATISL